MNKIRELENAIEKMETWHDAQVGFMFGIYKRRADKILNIGYIQVCLDYEPLRERYNQIIKRAKDTGIL